MSSKTTPPTLTWEPETFEPQPPLDWTTITERATSWLLITAVMGMMLLVGFIAGTRYGEPAPVITPPAITQPVTEGIQEDDPAWNCLTMGNRICGPEWTDVNTATVDDGSLLVDVLSEGDRSDWTGCLIRYETSTTGGATTIVCPDGYVERS